MESIARHIREFARYLRNTRGVSTLEYALVVGSAALAVFGAYEAFEDAIKAAMTALAQQVSGTN